jgi:hypothetical protein
MKSEFYAITLRFSLLSIIDSNAAAAAAPPHKELNETFLVFLAFHF